MKIISVREQPEYLERAVDYFAEKFLERRLYADCIAHSITTASPLPRWYMLIKKDSIIGCYGLITNDFISRQDLYPWFSALYIEESERGQQLGALLLEHGCKEAGRLGFKKLYIATDHIGYYEKYGWTYIAIGQHPWEHDQQSRIYEQQVMTTEIGLGKGL